MSKNKKIITKPKKDIKDQVMSQIKQGKINMKPKWYFVLGSALMIISLVGISIISIFLVNLLFFLLKKHGPMGQFRLELILASFPWWILIISTLLFVLAIFLLKKYDFSYQKNFKLIILAILISIIISAWAIDYLGFNETWSKGPMKGFYRQLNSNSSNNNFNQSGSGRGRVRKLR